VDRIAQLISLAFHPLWMPLVIYSLIRDIDPFFISGTPIDYFILLILVINAIAPALSLMIMIRFGMITDIQLRAREERVWPYLLVLFYYGISWGLVAWKDPGLPDYIPRFLIAVMASLAIALVVTLRWKISMHMIAQGGAAGALIAIRSYFPVDMTFPLIGLILIAAAVAMSRLHLKAHTHAQLYTGYALGVAVNWWIISSES